MLLAIISLLIGLLLGGSFVGIIMYRHLCIKGANAQTIAQQEAAKFSLQLEIEEQEKIILDNEDYRLVELNKHIDILCHSNEDNYMMELLAEITKYAIDTNYITYDNLYEYTEEKLMKILYSKDDTALKILLNLFKTVTLDEISIKELPKVKIRDINPLVNGTRIK